MTAKRIAAKFPTFAALFDGAGPENTLTFYYKKNKATDVFEFIDVEAEEEVAELMGVRVLSELVEDEDEKANTLKPLSSEQLTEFKEHMQDIRIGKEWLEQEQEQEQDK